MNEVDNSNTKHPIVHGSIRSFVLRQGRMTRGQQRAMQQLWPIYGLPPDHGLLNFSEIFGRVAPLVLEIGFGDGEALLAMTLRHPEMNFIGIEVHRPGVGSLLLKLEEAGISNIRLICDDAVEVIRQRFADNVLHRIHLFFPDPWHKKKHHKRRILNREFIKLISSKLIPGGVLHFATDWQDYAEFAMAELQSSTSLVNQVGGGEYAPRPDSRPETKFERRGHRLGHGVWDILMEKP